jgi:hypothetical protein
MRRVRRNLMASALHCLFVVCSKVETVCDSSRTVLDRNGTPRILADVAMEIPTS